MKRHKDLVSFLKAQGLRMTASKKALIQFFIDRQSHQITAEELSEYMERRIPGLDVSCPRRGDLNQVV